MPLEKEDLEAPLVRGAQLVWLVKLVQEVILVHLALMV